jgi:hypothetical protein
MSEYTEHLKQRFRTHNSQLAIFRDNIQKAIDDYSKRVRFKEAVIIASEKDSQEMFFGNNLIRPYFSPWGIYTGHILNEYLIQCHDIHFLIGIKDRLPKKVLSKLEEIIPDNAFSLVLCHPDETRDTELIQKARVYSFENVPFESYRGLLIEQLTAFHSGEICAICAESPAN